MTDWKMIDADGHIREVESDVFEYLPEHYKNAPRGGAVFSAAAASWLASPGGARGIGASFLIPTLRGLAARRWIKAISRRRWFIPRASCISARSA